MRSRVARVAMRFLCLANFEEYLLMIIILNKITIR